MKIYLVGFMGSGKTTIGGALATRLGFTFFDLDAAVEAAEKRTIREIFATEGEPYFRKIERDLLVATRDCSSTVIATGGGTFTFDDNVQLIRSEGLSVYLDVPFEIIARRIQLKAGERPLFRDESSARELYQFRTKYYRMADKTVEIAEGEAADAIVDRIVSELPAEWLPHPPGRAL